MNALFIVPCLVSPNVNPKLVPALCKLIERNILLTNSATFEKAALERYSKGPFSKVDSGLTKFGKGIGRGIKGVIDHPLAGFNTLNDDVELFYLSNFNLNENTLFEDIKSSAEADKERKARYQQYINSKSGKDNSKANFKNGKANPKADFENDWDYNNKVNPDFGITDAQRANNKKEHEADIDLKGSLGEKARAKAEKARAEAEKIKLEIENSKDPKHKEALQKQLDKTNMEIEKAKVEIARAKDQTRSNKFGAGGFNTDFEHAKRSHFGKIEDIESPTEVKFFQQISIEPTYIEIPITWKDTGNHEVSTTNIIRVGVKAVAYTVDSSVSIVGLLKESKNMAALERLFKKVFRSVIRNVGIKFFGGNIGTKGFKINSGDVDPSEAVNMIKYGPTARDLTRPADIGKLFNTTAPSQWSSMIVLSSYDLQDTNTDVNEIINNYRKIVDYVVGDLVITNETQESVYFCTIKTKSCQEIGFDYLQKVLNLAGVIDYSLVKKRPGTVFSKVNIMKAFKEHIDYEAMVSDIKNKIENIIN